MLQNTVMAKKKPTTEKRTRKYVEVRPVFIPAIEHVKRMLGEEDTGAINTLIREALEARKLWPYSDTTSEDKK